MLSLLKKMFKQNKAGFTLVELMAVVLIIGILVAVAIPVYKNSSNDAAEKACLANIRTIAGAVTQYTAAKGEAPADTADGLAALVTEGYIASIPVCKRTSVAYANTDLTNLIHSHWSGDSLDAPGTHDAPAS